MFLGAYIGRIGLLLQCKFVLYHDQGNLELLLDTTYSEWLNRQSYMMSNVGQDNDSHVKEKIAAIIEKLVECVEPTVSGEGGELVKQLLILMLLHNKLSFKYFKFSLCMATLYTTCSGLTVCSLSINCKSKLFKGNTFVEQIHLPSVPL